MIVSLDVACDTCRVTWELVSNDEDQNYRQDTCPVCGESRQAADEDVPPGYRGVSR